MDDDKNKKADDEQAKEELPKYNSDRIKSEEEEGRAILSVEKELRSDPKYREYFKDYKDSSWESFVTHYAFTKVNALKYGVMYLKQKEEAELKYFNMAEENIWDIQQKKLFNFQCLWRAEKVTSEHVEVIPDFYYWNHNIKCCPFLEPISDEEIEMYKNFLETLDVEDYDSVFNYPDWQDYEGYKEEHGGEVEGITYPEWYSYYDMRMGTSALMLLPDIRGEKEDYYLDIYHNHRRATEQQLAPLNIDRRKYLNTYDFDLMKGFIEKFEDSKVYRYMEVYSKRIWDDSNIDFEFFIHKINDIKEYIPIEAHYDWRIALVRAYNNYEKGKVLEQIDVVYRDYKDRLSMGIGYPEDNSYRLDTSDVRKKHLIEARVLNGEPPDLNF